MKKILTTMALAVCALTGASWMEAVAQDGDANRFRLEKTENGFVRLDTRTGALTLCRDENGILTCRMAADERAAYEKELDLIEKRVATLEKQMGGGSARPGPPSEDEIETSLSIMERFMRRFMGLVEEFKSEDNPPPVAPGRT